MTQYVQNTIDTIDTINAIDTIDKKECKGYNWSAQKDAKLHWLHLYDISSLRVLSRILKSQVYEDTKSQWLHLLNFSTLPVFKWLPNLSGQKDATQITFVWLCCTVYFHMSQEDAIRIALFAFVWLFKCFPN